MLEQIKQKRAEEIAQGKNLCTRNPIYLVYDVRFVSVEASSAFSQNCSLFNCEKEKYFRICNSDSEIILEVEPSDADWLELEVEVDGRIYGELYRSIFYDRLKGVFFTLEAAEAFIDADRHNMEAPKIYVDNISYKNTQILGLLGEK